MFFVQSARRYLKISPTYPQPITAHMHFPHTQHPHPYTLAVAVECVFQSTSSPLCTEFFLLSFLQVQAERKLIDFPPPLDNRHHTLLPHH